MWTMSAYKVLLLSIKLAQCTRDEVGPKETKSEFPTYRNAQLDFKVAAPVREASRDRASKAGRSY